MDNSGFEMDSGGREMAMRRKVDCDNNFYCDFLNENFFQESEANNPYSNMSAEERKKEKFQIYKNVLLISFSFLLLFVAFESMGKLQSSINKVGQYFCPKTNNVVNIYNICRLIILVPGP